MRDGGGGMGEMDGFRRRRRRRRPGPGPGKVMENIWKIYGKYMENTLKIHGKVMFLPFQKKEPFQKNGRLFF